MAKTYRIYRTRTITESDNGRTTDDSRHDKLMDELRKAIDTASRYRDGGPTWNTRWNGEYSYRQGASELDSYFGEEVESVSYPETGNDAENTRVYLRNNTVEYLTPDEMNYGELEGVLNFINERIYELEELYERCRNNPDINRLANATLDGCRSFIENNGLDRKGCSARILGRDDYQPGWYDKHDYRAIEITKGRGQFNVIMTLKVRVSKFKVMSVEIDYPFGGGYGPRVVNDKRDLVIFIYRTLNNEFGSEA